MGPLVPWAVVAAACCQALAARAAAGWRTLEDRAAARLAWHRARTLADLGELTAAWLEGTLATHPGYHGRPAPETRELAGVLAAANRAGYVTIGSQPATGAPGLHQRQRAGVEGLAPSPIAARLLTAATDAGLVAIARGPARRRCGDATGTIAVTLVGDHVVTDFGAHLSRRTLRRIFAGCHPAALAAAGDAWQLTLIDPAWGRNDRLWALLDASLAAGARPGRHG